MRRNLQFWWYRVVLIILGGLLSPFLALFALANLKATAGCIIVLLVVIVAIKRMEISLLLLIAIATPFLPKITELINMDVYPSILLLILLFLVVMVKLAFRTQKLILPSIWVIWPFLGLVLVAIISSLLIQLTWTYGVSHTLVPQMIKPELVVLRHPVIYDELAGIFIYAFPIITIVVVMASLTKKDQWVTSIQYTIVALSVMMSLIFLIDFKRTNATIYTYRFIEPSIGWMVLQSIAHLIGIGSILAYAQLLSATRWSTRLLFGGSFLLCIFSLYLTLENTWWLEVIVAVTVITIVHSRKLFFAFSAALIPFLPLLQQELFKLLAAKSEDLNRIVIWQDVLRVWAKYPVFGVGPGNFWVYDQAFTNLPIAWGLRNFSITGLGMAHNAYLQTLAETGIVGEIFLLSGIISLLVTITRFYRRSKKSKLATDSALGLSALGLLSGAIISDTVSNAYLIPFRQLSAFYILPSMLLCWTIFGCVLYKNQVWRMGWKREM